MFLPCPQFPYCSHRVSNSIIIVIMTEIVNFVNQFKSTLYSFYLIIKTNLGERSLLSLSCRRHN